MSTPSGGGELMILYGEDLSFGGLGVGTKAGDLVYGGVFLR